MLLTENQSNQTFTASNHLSTLIFHTHCYSFTDYLILFSVFLFFLILLLSDFPVWPLTVRLEKIYGQSFLLVCCCFRNVCIRRMFFFFFSMHPYSFLRAHWDSALCESQFCRPIFGVHLIKNMAVLQNILSWLFCLVNLLLHWCISFQKQYAKLLFLNLTIWL